MILSCKTIKENDTGKTMYEMREKVHIAFSHKEFPLIGNDDFENKVLDNGIVIKVDHTGSTVVAKLKNIKLKGIYDKVMELAAKEKVYKYKGFNFPFFVADFDAPGYDKMMMKDKPVFY